VAGAKPLVSWAFDCDPLSCLETLGAGQVIFEAKRIAIVGGGPAGLRAAEVCAAAGMKVVLFDAKRSVGRKFLVAGKGGLNLTNAEPEDIFANRYSGKNSDFWRGVLEVFDSGDLREWALELGFETFVTKSGRVYLKDLKAAGLLRRWVARLREMGVIFQTNHRLVDLNPGRPFQLVFENGAHAEADAVILAFGGGSWPETGSDGRWFPLFEKLGLSTRPLAPANCGWEHDWPPEVLQAAEGKPLKNIRVTAEEKSASGELILTRYGLEGGPLYALGSALRTMDAPAISIDLKPAHSVNQLVAKMESVRRNFASEARLRWKLGDAACALLARKEWKDAPSLAREAKNVVIPLRGPRPISEAISSAGGVRWEELTEDLMVEKIPGLFVAGEMIDWEAPTGGFLLQACFATGTLAAQSACKFCQ
jgi:uncharacterized flavoprotein (TIGR03862 family)